jgi:DNA-binding GntR family transcriptional regulator
MSNCIENEISGIISNYTLNNWNRTKKDINQLKSYIKQTRHINIGSKELSAYIRNFKKEIKSLLEITTTKAVLLTKENKVKIYKFSSELCPQCGKYKNFEKTCPYCEHMELVNS